MKLLLFDLDGTILHARHTPGRVPFDLAMRDTFDVTVELARMRPDGKTDPMIAAAPIPIPRQIFASIGGRWGCVPHQWHAPAVSG